MLLSHRHRFIYTKTLKTAGTSVEIYFEDACIPADMEIDQGHHIGETVTPAGVIGYRGPAPAGSTWYNHMCAREIRELVGGAVWDGYYKFCVVRNPFDKVVSYWWFTVNSKQQYQYKDADFARVRSDFADWCVTRSGDAVDRDTYVIDGRLAMDFFIKYESLLDGLAQVCRRVCYPYRPERLGTYKGDARATRRPFCEYHDQRTIAAVQAAFSWELDWFGYSRPSMIPVAV